MQLLALTLAILYCDGIEGSQIFASGANRKDFILDVTATYEIHNVSIVECLGFCKKRGCKSFNYGQRHCSLLNSFYCDSNSSPESLTSKPGYSYYDVAESADKEVSPDQLSSDICKKEQKCSNRCKGQTMPTQASNPTTTPLEPTTTQPEPTTTPAPECVTNDAYVYSAPAGSKCVFPFQYKGIEYDGCISIYNEYTDIPWCSTSTTSKEFDYNQFGTCDPSCPKDNGCVTDGKFGPSPAGTNCTFPFIHEGIEHVQCTNFGNMTDNSEVNWCSTNPGSTAFDSNHWGSCGPKCPVKECKVKSYDKKCLLPMEWNGRTYETCTNGKYTKADGYQWCYYDESKNWDYCITECPRIWNDV